jgi:hypothetical protein
LGKLSFAGNLLWCLLKDSGSSCCSSRLPAGNGSSSSQLPAGNGSSSGNCQCWQQLSRQNPLAAEAEAAAAAAITANVPAVV